MTTSLFFALVEQMKKDQKETNDQPISFKNVKLSISRNRNIDGRMGCGAGYNVVLKRDDQKYYTRYNASRFDGERRPKQLDVLHNILLDAQCYESTQSLSDFCLEFGYDEISECRRAYERLSEMFTKDELEQLQEILQEY